MKHLATTRGHSTVHGSRRTIPVSMRTRNKNSSLGCEWDDFGRQSGIIAPEMFDNPPLPGTSAMSLARSFPLPRDQRSRRSTVIRSWPWPTTARAHNPRSAGRKGRPRDGRGSQEPLGVAHSRPEAQDRFRFQRRAPLRLALHTQAPQGLALEGNVRRAEGPGARPPRQRLESERLHQGGNDHQPGADSGVDRAREKARSATRSSTSSTSSATRTHPVPRSHGAGASKATTWR